MDENQRSKTVKRVKTAGCITLAALIGFGAGLYIKGATDENQRATDENHLNFLLNSGEKSVVFHIDKVEYTKALHDFDWLLIDMIPENQQSRILNLKERIRHISPTGLMKKANSLSTILEEKPDGVSDPKVGLITSNHPDMEDYYKKDNLVSSSIYNASYNLGAMLELYLNAEKGLNPLWKSGAIQDKIISTYIDLLLTETMKSKLDKDEDKDEESLMWEELLVDAPRYQNELLSYLKEREITNNPGIKEEKISAFLDASGMLINNVLSKCPEENAFEWLKYLDVTNEISKLFGIPEQYRKEKLDPVKEFISEYCNQKVDNVKLD